MFTKLESLVIGILVSLALLSQSLFIVSAGKVGIVTRFGAINRNAYPGLNFKIPFVEWVQRMDTRTQKITMETESASSDMQKVEAVITVNYFLDANYAIEMWQRVGKDYEEKVVLDKIEQAFKYSSAQFNPEDIIQKRDDLANETKLQLQLKLDEYNITVRSVSITNIDFSEEYNNSIEEKQVMQQKIETAELERQRAEIIAETVKIEAQAQADAQKLLNQSDSLSEEYLQYLFLTSWNGVLPQVMLGESNSVFDVGDYINEQ